MPNGNGTAADVRNLTLAENQPEGITSSGFGTPDYPALKLKGFGFQSEPANRQKGFGIQSEQTIKPKGFGAPNKSSETRQSVFGSSDLDTKCDISVRSNGLSKVFSESGDDFRTGYIQLDNEDRSDVSAFKSLTGSTACFNKGGARNYSELAAGFQREHSCSPENLYVNENLPEKCPW